MTIEYNTREKLRAIIAQLDQLLLTDINFPSTKEGLTLFREFFQRTDDRVVQAADLRRAEAPVECLYHIQRTDNRISPVYGVPVALDKRTQQL